MVVISSNVSNSIVYFGGCEWKKNSLKMTGEIMNGENSGRNGSTGDMYIEFDSVFYNYEGEIVRKPNCTDEEWDRLWEILIEDNNDHYIWFPWTDENLDGEAPNWKTSAQYVYISSMERVFVQRKGNKNKWSSTYKLKLTSMNPYVGDNVYG